MLAFTAFALAAERPARANGAFPDEFSVHFPANAPHRILIGSNFGLLVSEDDGTTWRYSCEPWVTVGSSDPLSPALVLFYQVTADGAVLADSVNVTRSTDGACTWPAATGAVAGQAVDDLFPDPNDPNLVLAIVTTATGSYIVASHDGGVTFDPTILFDVRSTDSALLTGIEIARSTPGVYYATSVSTNGGLGKFYASTNAGVNWTPYTTLPLTSATQPRILAIDPADSQTVYVRLLSGPSDGLAITHDGGQTFITELPISGQFSAFLRAGDGAIYAGTMDGRLWVKPAGATDFGSPKNAPHLRCLGQRIGTSRIYACGDMVLDGASLFYSDDNAATFHPVMSFTQLLGPLTCAPVQTACQAHWERIQGVLGIGAAQDAGQGGGGGGGGSNGGSGGSHCAAAGVETWSIWLLIAFALQRRRDNSRARRRTSDLTPNPDKCALK